MAEFHEQKNDEPYERRIKKAFYFWGNLIADRSDGAYVVVDPGDPDLDDEHNEFMDLDTAYYPATDDFLLPDDHTFGKLLLRELVDKLLPRIEDFEKIVDMFLEQEELIEQLRAMVEHPDEEHPNILVLTNHPWFMNIAILEAALFCAVDRPGFYQHLGITVSKTLGFMEGVIGEDEEDSESDEPMTLPVLRVLRTMGDVFTSVPSTDSTKLPELIELQHFATEYKEQGFNFLMMRPYLKKAKAGKGFVSIMAGSGSLDKPSEENPDLLIMKPIADTAARLLNKTASKAVVVATFMDSSGTLSAEIVGINDINTPDDIHDAMHMIVPAYQAFVGNGLTVKYDDPRHGQMAATEGLFDAAPETPL